MIRVTFVYLQFKFGIASYDFLNDKIGIQQKIKSEIGWLQTSIIFFFFSLPFFKLTNKNNKNCNVPEELEFFKNIRKEVKIFRILKFVRTRDDFNSKIYLNQIFRDMWKAFVDLWLLYSFQKFLLEFNCYFYASLCWNVL